MEIIEPIQEVPEEEEEEEELEELPVEESMIENGLDNNDIKNNSELNSNIVSIQDNNKQIEITWSDIEKEDKELANELKIMCVEYGYDLDHTKIPQNEETKQFTA
jgi:hypothetical protein